MDEKLEKVKKILVDYGKQATKLITILQQVQEIYTYLPEDVMEYIAIELGITAGQVFGAATFYANFALEPKGKHVIKICDGTACHVKKSTDIIRAIQVELKLSDKKHTSDDGLFTLEIVACLGACGLAPVVVVDDDVYGSMTKEKAIEVLNKYRGMEVKNG